MKPRDPSPLRFDRATALGLRLLKALRQPLTFLAVGFGSTVVNALLSIAMVSLLGWAPVAAGLVAYLLMIPPTYLAQRTLTFAFKAEGEVRFMRYAALQTLGLLTSAAGNCAFAQATREFHGSYFFISLMVSAGFNFLVMRIWVFADAPTMATRPAEGEG